MSAVTLPPLRQDLRLHSAAPDRDGSPTWTIQDPVTNRFFRIGWLEFECLLRWPAPAEHIAADIAATTTLSADPDQVMGFAGFLMRNQLLRLDGQAVARLAVETSAPTWRDWRWWLHHYLFIRIPLARPERWLRIMHPFFRPLTSRLGLTLLLCCSLVGLLLAARQWDLFTHSLAALFTPAGIGGFALALIVCKSCHELGHALVATGYGVRVGHMGVALVVLWPMLYTDVAESWKLRSARQRLMISAAGLGCELAIAGLATLVWALLDDGPARQAALYAATTGWVVSLALNASPFMRFDGYFILSDLLDMANLHERSSALTRCWLRRRLLGWNEPDPEFFTPHLRVFLRCFALATWCYRLAVFLGIAAAVYFFFFKALGIFLFTVEIGWFIVRPILAETKVWIKRRRETASSRRLLGLSLACMMIVLAVWPLTGRVNAPAAAHPAMEQLVFSPFAARLTHLRQTGPVAAGELLAEFQSPDLVARHEGNQALARGLSQRLAAVNAEDEAMDQRRVAGEQLGEQLAQTAANLDEQSRLLAHASFTGVWLDLDPLLRTGGWVSPRTQVGLLIDPQRWVVDAYVEQRQIERIRLGAAAHFRPDGAWKPVPGRVVDIETSPSTRLTTPLLDDKAGGPIAVRSVNGAGKPIEALYRVRLELDQPLPTNRQTRGQAIIEGEKRSWLTTIATSALAVLIRESGL